MPTHTLIVAVRHLRAARPAGERHKVYVPGFRPVLLDYHQPDRTARPTWKAAYFGIEFAHPQATDIVVMPAANPYPEHLRKNDDTLWLVTFDTPDAYKP
jgi:hypothetical protein